MCELCVLQALAAHRKALQIEPEHKEALLDMAIVYMSVSNAGKALEYINMALAVDPTVKNVHGYKGLMLQNQGMSRECIAAFAEVHKLDPTDTQALQFTAICYQAIGDFRRAIEWFDKTLQVDPDHYSWSLREIAFYRWQHLDTPLLDYNFDTDVHWLIKVIIVHHIYARAFFRHIEKLKMYLQDGWIRRDPRKNYCAPGPDPYCHHELKLHHPSAVQALSSSGVGLGMHEFYSSAALKKQLLRELVNITSQISRWIQVDSPGFLRHQRQHRMFGVREITLATCYLLGDQSHSTSLTHLNMLVVMPGDGSANGTGAECTHRGGSKRRNTGWTSCTELCQKQTGPCGEKYRSRQSLAGYQCV
jgi:hypothetical protein